MLQCKGGKSLNFFIELFYFVIKVVLGIGILYVIYLIYSGPRVISSDEDLDRVSKGGGH
jgi:hypothetical protein